MAFGYGKYLPERAMEIMQLVNAVADVPRRGTGNFVAIGKWDGVHLAHQAIIRQLVHEAREAGGQSVVMGFHPLPMAVLSPDRAPSYLQTLAERAETLAALGVDVYLALPFNLAFASMAAEDFVRDVLVGALRARRVRVGFNFTFGAGGKATASDLVRLSGYHAVPVDVAEPVREVGENISSSLVRLYVSGGEMERTAALLGRPFTLTGVVVTGDKRGRTIGYPTANLQLAEGRQLPATGVYAVRATVLDGTSPCGTLPCNVAPRGGRTHSAMLNLGWRPTFQGRDLRCEVHLFDFAEEIYGREVSVAFVQRLRAEQAFSGIDELVDQLRRDEQAARACLEGDTHVHGAAR